MEGMEVSSEWWRVLWLNARMVGVYCSRENDTEDFIREGIDGETRVDAIYICWIEWLNCSGVASRRAQCIIYSPSK